MRRALALLALALLAACGSFSRSTLAERELNGPTEPAALTRLRGSDPLLSDVWYVSAHSQATPAAALDIVQRGLTYHPGLGDLVYAQVSLLASMGKRDAQIAAAQAELANDPPSNLEAMLRHFLVDGRIALDDPFGAQDETMRLGGVPGVEPDLVSSAWSETALSFEFLGNRDEADDAIDNSLDLGPHGIGTLRELTAITPARAASAHLLVQRAVERHPRQPDLQQFLAVDLMLAGDLPGAEQALDRLPQPLPERMRPDVAALRARLDLMQGRIEPALARLREELDRSPGAIGPLYVLLECWRSQGQPDDAEMLLRLRRARHRIADPGFERQVEIMLQRVDQGASLKESLTPPSPAAPAPQPSP